MKTAVFILIFILAANCYSQEDYLHDSFIFLGSEKMSMDVGGINSFLFSSKDELAAFTDFPLLFNYNFNRFNRFRFFFNIGLYQSSLKENAGYASLGSYGPEYAYFIIRDSFINLGLKLRHSLVKISSENDFKNVTSFQCLLENKLIDFKDDKVIGNLRVFAIIGGYYLYDKKMGGLSLLAGISIGNGIRLSFDFASFIYKTNDIYRFLAATANTY